MEETRFSITVVIEGFTVWDGDVYASSLIALVETFQVDPLFNEFPWFIEDTTTGEVLAHNEKWTPCYPQDVYIAENVYFGL